MKVTALSILYFILTITLCMAAEPRPEWLDRQSRHVIGGDIMHAGQGLGPTPEVARFKAESMAVKNVISECSLAHRDIVIWDRYLEQLSDKNFRAYARAGINTAACEEAIKAKGESRRSLSNPELVRNQDIYSQLEGLTPQDSVWNSIKDRVYMIIGKQESRTAAAEQKMAVLEAKMSAIEQAKVQTIMIRTESVVRAETPTPPLHHRSVDQSQAREARYKDCMADYEQLMVEVKQIARDFGKPRGNFHSPNVQPHFNRANTKKSYCQKIRASSSWP
ncbi:hypothetical protein WDW37_18170 [Bdellovibrionota bacterium FG-1]